MLTKNKTITLIIIILITLFAIFDFINFYRKSLSIKNTLDSNSNLVVLTGGTNRIKQTINLFFLKKNKKYNLLISGAGKGFNKKAIANLFPRNEKLLNKISCCIEIENKSKDTKSNALETFKWVKKNNFKSVTLITSNYHMPRALIEFKKILFDIEIVPFNLNDKKSGQIIYFKNFLFEYIKFKITKIRIGLKK